MLNRRGFMSVLGAGLAGCQGGGSMPPGGSAAPPAWDPIFVAEAGPGVRDRGGMAERQVRVSSEKHLDS